MVLWEWYVSSMGGKWGPTAGGPWNYLVTTSIAPKFMGT